MLLTNQKPLQYNPNRKREDDTLPRSRLGNPSGFFIWRFMRTLLATHKGGSGPTTVDMCVKCRPPTAQKNRPILSRFYSSLLRLYIYIIYNVAAKIE